MEQNNEFISDLSASVWIKNTNNIWIDDSMVNCCNSCGRNFTLFYRKHHCRYCGNIFCDKCTNYLIVIPSFITDKPDAGDYWNLSYYISPMKNNEEKVCKQCYDLVNEKIKNHSKIAKIFNDPVSIVKILQLTESNNDIKNHYINQLRNMQYYLPSHIYTDIDKKFLAINAPLFSKHSKYLVQLIKSIVWHEDNTNNNLKLVVDIINGAKQRECNELYCTRTCQEVLSCDDCVNILYSCTEYSSESKNLSSNNFLPDILLKYLFEIISKSSDQIILCHIPFFATLVKNNSKNKLLRDSLYKLLSSTLKIVYSTYWFINIYKEDANIQEINNINNFINMYDSILVKRMTHEFRFYVGLIQNLKTPKEYLLEYFNKYSPISVPYNPEIKLTKVNYDNIVVKSSYTKPVIIEFDTNYGKINLLFKKESIMNDVTVLNLMTLTDIILSENLITNFGAIIYPIMPLTNNSGMIEIIDNAQTIHSIINNKKTILQHIISKNENCKISDVMNRYMYSLISYTLHSYFLGLGDRHLQNIMISDDGAIFHIDFGFILGTDAYPLTSNEIKLSSDMLDVIGGKDSERYNLYLEYCATGIKIIRKYFNMFFILFSQNTKYEKKRIEKFIMSRFQPRQLDRVVIEELMTIIEKSHKAYSGIIRDYLHYHNQEKTVQNTFGKVIKTALTAMSSFTNSH